MLKFIFILLQLDFDPMQRKVNDVEVPDTNRLTLILALQQQNFETIDLGIANDPITLQAAFFAGCKKG